MLPWSTPYTATYTRWCARALVWIHGRMDGYPVSMDGCDIWGGGWIHHQITLLSLLVYVLRMTATSTTTTEGCTDALYV